MKITRLPLDALPDDTMALARLRSMCYPLVPFLNTSAARRA